MRWFGIHAFACLSLIASAAELPPGVDGVKLGQALAQELRSAAPTEAAEFTGVLKITKPGFTNAVPIECQIDLHSSARAWTVTYRTKGGGNQPPQRLAIKHWPGAPNEYEYAEGSGVAKTLTREQLTLPLAGSDFWLMDLGLEFLHWPSQQVTGFEMRRGRSCRILQSVDPKPTPGGYARVLSWIDVETDGILLAEAYDAKSEKIKVFEVGSFKRIKGQWQLQDMEIRNPKARTRTKLEFNLQK